MALFQDAFCIFMRAYINSLIMLSLSTMLVAAGEKRPKLDLNIKFTLSFRVGEV
jgi:hypothetical protein